jgi:hypothetical protein
LHSYSGRHKKIALDFLGDSEDFGSFFLERTLGS